MQTKRVKAIICAESECLIVKNRFSIHDDGFGLPGGEMKRFETPEDTLYRELKEELGLTREEMKTVTLLGSADAVTHNFFKTKNTEYIFFKVICEKKPTIRHSFEIKQSQWVEEQNVLPSLSSFYQSLLSHLIKER